MPNSTKLARTVSLVMEQTQEFQTLEDSMKPIGQGKSVIPIVALREWLGYDETDTRFERAINRAKIALMKTGQKTAEHFFDAELFDGSRGVYVSLKAALLVIINADPNKTLVARAQNYFASKLDEGIHEDEKRLKNRYDVIEENKKLSSAAKDAGVKNFGMFHAAGYRGMYANKNIDEVAKMKGLKKGSEVLDYAGSEELAAHLFRITQTNAKLQRDNVKTEHLACVTHMQVGTLVRNAIRQMGGTMPELLPKANHKIDVVEARTRMRLEKGQQQKD